MISWLFQMNKKTQDTHISISPSLLFAIMWTGKCRTILLPSVFDFSAHSIVPCQITSIGLWYSIAENYCAVFELGKYSTIRWFMARTITVYSAMTSHKQTLIMCFVYVRISNAPASICYSHQVRVQRHLWPIRGNLIQYCLHKDIRNNRIIWKFMY